MGLTTEPREEVTRLRHHEGHSEDSTFLIVLILLVSLLVGVCTVAAIVKPKPDVPEGTK